MNTKKVYVELVDLLEANKDKKISTILEQIYELTTSKQVSSTFLKDKSGKVTHIYCYYHKKFEPLSEVEYGAKKHSTTGFNSMCKEGVNQWTKQQRVAKQKEAELLDKVISKEISPDGIQEEKIKIEQERKSIIPREDGIGFDSLEDIK